MLGNTMMKSFLYASSTTVFSKTSHLITRNSSTLGFCSYYSSSWNRRMNDTGSSIKAIKLGICFTNRFRVQCYSSTSPRITHSKKSKKSNPESEINEEKDPFFVIRKGDIIGIYKSLSDCQAQVGNWVYDPSVSVFKGYSLPKETEEYLGSRGLRNSLYTVNAVDVNKDVFGELVHCPFQDPFSEKPSPSKISQVSKLSNNSTSCILEFDGASKGNPGLAGAGAILRTEDGKLLCRLREGVGIATNNVAEYRAMILGLKQALKKGFKRISVKGDSKLAYMQVMGHWKTKSDNLITLSKEAKELKLKFDSFEIRHVLREFTPEADEQANKAVFLEDGQVEEDYE